jgi:hypothetical protein
MNLKSAFMFRLLEMCGCMTAQEIEDIRIANSLVQRVKPIKTSNLLLREFVISDILDLVTSRICRTVKEAEKLTVETVQDAAENVRKRLELAVVLEEDEKMRVIGRIGIRSIGRSIKTADGELMSKVKKTFDRLQGGERILLLYIFVNPELDDRGYAKEVIDAFIPASAKVMGHELTIETRTSSDVAGKWGLKRIDECDRR